MKHKTEVKGVTHREISHKYPGCRPHGRHRGRDHLVDADLSNSGVAGGLDRRGRFRIGDGRQPSVILVSLAADAFV